MTIEQRKTLKFVIVYQGVGRLPNYVSQSLQQIKKNFSNIDCYFLTDNESWARKVENQGIQVWFGHDSQVIPMFRSLLSSNDSRYSDFWAYTIGRFILIEAFMRETGVEPILQIEADVWLAPNFPYKKFEKLKEMYAFPLQGSNLVVPSLVYIANHKGAERLSQHVIERVKSGKLIDDNDILFDFYSKNLSSTNILPTTPSNLSWFVDEMQEQLISTMSKNSKYFGGIFDACTWGQFITGEEHRNGIRKVFHFQEKHGLRTDLANFSVSPKKSLDVQIAEQKVPLFNLHIHSKVLEMFESDGLKYIEKRIEQFSNNRHERFEFSLSAFFSQARKQGLVSTLQGFTRFMRQRIRDKFLILN